jgi:hypothetical protein
MPEPSGRVSTGCSALQALRGRASGPVPRMLLQIRNNRRLSLRLAAVVTSSATPSGVFCQKLPRETGSAEFPFGRQWAASVPSAGASLKQSDIPFCRSKHEHARERMLSEWYVLGDPRRNQ